MSDSQSALKRSSRTPKFSAKRLAFEEENNQKKRKVGEPKQVVSTPPKAKPPPASPSSPKKTTRKSEPSTGRVRSRSTKSKAASLGGSPAVKHAPSPVPIKEPDLDVSQRSETPPLIIDEASSTTSSTLVSSLSPSKLLEVKKKSRKKGEGGNSDDEAEEKWLQALESGKLEEVDAELKSIKDPKLMTARQRAVIEAKQARVEHLQQVQALQEALKDQHAAELMTEEVIEKRAIKAAKRKQLAEAKRDKEKKETIKRLLQKNDSRQKLKKLQKQKALLIPKISYRYTYEGITVSFPNEALPATLGIDLTPKIAQYPTPVLCSNPGCTNIKLYQCSSNGLPVCSLACYKQVEVLPPLAQLLEAAAANVDV